MRGSHRGGIAPRRPPLARVRDLVAAVLLASFAAAAAPAEPARPEAAGAPSSAAPAARPARVDLSLVDAARLLIAQGELAGAREVLQAELRQNPRSTEALFLAGQVEGLDGHWDRAAEFYRRVLVDHPELARVRLELARALYELGDDATAEYHFKLATAEPQIPEAVIDNVSRYLTSIRQRKR